TEGEEPGTMLRSIVWRLLRPSGGARRVCGPTRVDDAGIGLCERLAGCLGRAAEAVQVEPGEDGAVERLARLGRRRLIEVARPVEEFESRGEDGPAGVEFVALGFELSLDALLPFPHLLKSGF